MMIWDIKALNPVPGIRSDGAVQLYMSLVFDHQLVADSPDAKNTWSTSMNIHKIEEEAEQI